MRKKKPTKIKKNTNKAQAFVMDIHNNRWWGVDVILQYLTFWRLAFGHSPFDLDLGSLIFDVLIFLKSLWLWIRPKLNIKQGALRLTRTWRLPLNTRTINVQTMNNPKPWTMQRLTMKNQNNEISYTSTFHPPLQLPTWTSMTITANVLVILHRGYRYRFVPISRTELSVSSTQPRSWLAPAFRHFKSPEICTWFGRNKEGKMKKNKKKRFSTWRGGRGGLFQGNHKEI